jgi:hypothetical protein
VLNERIAEVFQAEDRKSHAHITGDDGRGGKRGELAQLEDTFRDAGWEVKKRHDATLQGALAGYRANKVKFKNRLVTECQKKAPVPLPTQSDLEARSASLFGTTPTTESLLATINDTQFLAWETDPILAKRVIGKSDVDIAAMILRLDNSDWVRQGIAYYDVNDGDCPFCQQKAPQSLAASLQEYFDETFTQDTSAIATLRNGYVLAGDRIGQTVDAVVATASRFLETDAPRTQQNAGHARPQRLDDHVERSRHAAPRKRRTRPCPHARSCGRSCFPVSEDCRCSRLRRTASAALKYVLRENIPLRYSRKSGVVKIKKVLWLKKAMVARPRSRKLQEKIPSLLTRPKCFHERVFAGDCSNRHTGSPIS